MEQQSKANRADRLISEAAARGQAVRDANFTGSDDTAARAGLAYEVGMLRGLVADLCAELTAAPESNFDKLRRLIREAREVAEQIHADPMTDDGADAVCDQLADALGMVDDITSVSDEPDYEATDYMAAAKERAEEQRQQLRSGLNY